MGAVLVWPPQPPPPPPKARRPLALAVVGGRGRCLWRRCLAGEEADKGSVTRCPRWRRVLQEEQGRIYNPICRLSEQRCTRSASSADARRRSATVGLNGLARAVQTQATDALARVVVTAGPRPATRHELPPGRLRWVGEPPWETRRRSRHLPSPPCLSPCSDHGPPHTCRMAASFRGAHGGVHPRHGRANASTVGASRPPPQPPLPP